MLEAYFDESERIGGVFCVAGYAFAPEQARKFTKAWSALFADYGGCHMVELLARQGRFKGIAPSERDRLLREAVRIINKRISFGVSVSCNVAEVRMLSPSWIRGFGHAYPLCCHLSMASLGKRLHDDGLSERVTYIFESGHEFEAEARDFVRSMVESPIAKDAYRYQGDAFLSKKDAVPLQAADVLAWEWAKFRDETLEQHLRPIRQSLLVLFEGRVKQYCGYHITGPSLVNYFQKVRDMGLLQLQEERMEKEARQQRTKI